MMTEQEWPKQNRRKSDEWFRLLVESMNEGLAVQDENGFVIYVNQRICAMLGYSQDEMIGQARTEFFDEANQTILAEQTAKRERGEIGSYEIAWTAKDGRKVLTLVSPKPLFDQKGQFRGSFAVITDITERKRVEEQLITLSSAIEQSPVAVVITDPEGNIEYVNLKFTQLTGYCAEEVIGKNPRILKSGKTSLAAYQRLWDSILACREWRGEIQDRRKNGELYWANEAISPIKNAEGKITHFLALQEDITDRRLAEDALRESEKKYSTLVESSLTGIYIAQDGKIAYANTKFAEIFGYAKEDLLGLETWRLIHPEDRALIEEMTTKRLKGEPAPPQQKIRGVTKDRETLWIKGSDTRIDYRGRPAILGNIVDVTQEKRIEEILWNSERELRILSTQLLSAQEQERKRIASELHDSVGQYLSAIKFSLENINHLFATDATEPGEKPLASIVPMIQDTMEEVRRISMDLRPSMLDDLGILATINWYCRKFQTIYCAIQIEKCLDIQESDVPATLKTVIYRVTQEALTNVAKHAEADHVDLSLRKTTDAIELIIKDDGRGFELGEALSRDISQRGLGLSSMRERTELSGGSFSIDSTLGVGTIVRAVWPC